ncbi:MAG: response regulator [Rhodobacteraceae bacterium]|nr:response regulator [Paracoccaceae bacterium]
MDSVDNGNDIFQRKLVCRAHKPKKFRVLVVDDEPSILELLKMALPALDNYDVSIANSAANALKTLEGQSPEFDCFLLDIQMPETNGVQLLEQIRAIPEYSDTPAIMLTAMSDRKYVDEAFLAGATDYVTKPFDMLELRSRMKAAYRLSQERQKVREGIQITTQLRNELAYNQEFSFDDPVTIEGIDRFLRHAEFDNYIMQLSRGRLFNSHATALKLLDAEFFFDTKPCGDFKHVLKDIAVALAKLTKKSGSILSYRGKGVFLVVTHGNANSGNALDEILLNQLVETLISQRLSECWAYVLIGDKVPMRSLSKAGAVATLNTAIESVNARNDKNEEQQIVLERVNEGPGASITQISTHSRRRVYERVMHQLFREDASRQSK